MPSFLVAYNSLFEVKKFICFFELFIYFIRQVMTDIIPDNKILNLSNTSGSVLRKFRILYVLSSGYSQSASLLAHNRITAPQFIRRSLHSSWYKQVPTHCLLLFATPAGDLLDSVKKWNITLFFSETLVHFLSRKGTIH